MLRVDDGLDVPALAAAAAMATPVVLQHASLQSAMTRVNIGLLWKELPSTPSVLQVSSGR